MNQRRLVMVLLLVGLGLQVFAAPGDGHWDRQFAMPGTGSRNLALRSTGDLLYTGGYSLSYGQLATNTIINVFDGLDWMVLGQARDNSFALIYDFAFLQGSIYVGGLFDSVDGVPASGLAKWDGASWSDVGGFTGLVFCMATDGANLYVGGSFTNAGGVLTTNLAKWDGASWSDLGGGVGVFGDGSFAVQCLGWRGGQIYVGGTFTNAGSTPATNFARWDGASWSQVGSGVGVAWDSVSTIQFMGDDIYVAGKFTSAGGVPALNIARWNGASWSALGAGLKGPSSSTPVNALTFLGSDLYATGNFTNAGGITATRVAKWNGNAWSSLGALNGTGTRAISNAGSIYITGDFNLASNVIGNHIIRFDGYNWYGVTGRPANGTHLFVQSLALGADGLYMGGFFSAVGATPAACIARWDGAALYPVGDGVSGSYNRSSLAVRAIKARNNEVYVGGGFVNAGPVTANNIALWDGLSWSSLGYGVDATVGAIETSDAVVYVGGSFTNAYNYPDSGHTVNRIARWDSMNGWLPLGSGVSGTVNTICLANGVVYVGGSFTTAGGIAANRIAVWDGFGWSSLGSGSANGTSSTVNAILADGSDLYVGGSFTSAGGNVCRSIAKWNGSAWSSLGQGFFSTSTASVLALAKVGSWLYAAGNCTNVDGTVNTRSIARWDGTHWEALGSGVGNDMASPRVYSLAAWGTDLYVGGIFETAGVADSGYIARWNDQIDFAPPAVMRLSSPQMLPGNLFKFNVRCSVGASYVVEYSPDLQNWSALVTNSLSFLEVTDSVPDVNARSYRARQIP